MANFVFNIACGRVAEMYRRVDADDPSGSVLVFALLATTGLETDTVLRDKDTFADVVSGTTNEATNTGYARVILSETGVTWPGADDTNNRVDLPLAANLDFGPMANDGTGAVSKIVVCYDPVAGSGTDADLIPLTCHDFAATADGSNIVAVPPAAFYSASSVT